MEDSKKLALVEAVLFATNDPLTIEDIRKITKLRTETIENLIKVLKKRYDRPEYGIFLSDTAGYKLSVKQEFSTSVSNLAKADMSKGLLRVLSVIACHEPVKQADIVRIIGNRTYDYTKTLQEMGFITFEKKGSTKILKTTAQFEQYFGTRKEEIKNLYKKMQEDKPAKKIEEPKS
ncbi:MAG: SMC-Scp complex subunit ScpB [Candidatus Aenigmarchaeota archaeon]|nr:SMC-Scp complex subunit ScpB [Candidatus Aenigmarchaeota archaeon]